MKQVDKTDRSIAGLRARRREIMVTHRSFADRRRAIRKLSREWSDALHQAACICHADVNPVLNARKRLSTAQKLSGLIVLILATVFLAGAPGLTFVSIILAYLAFCWAVLGLRVAAFFKVLFQAAPSATVTEQETAPGRWPGFTLLVPLYKESASLPGLVQCLRQLNYPPELLDIKFLLEEDDRETRISAELHCTDDHMQIVTVPPGGPRTKPKALNYGLWMAVGGYTVIYDAEDRPEPDQLIKAANAFTVAGPETACLQAHLNYYNRQQNWLTRLFSLEYSTLFDLTLPGLSRMGLPIPLGGTSNFFKTKLLVAVGGWDPFNVTEDADMGLRLYRAGYEIGILGSTTLEEAPANLRDWLLQRSRWIKGYLQTWLVHTRQTGSLFSSRNRNLFIITHLVVGGVIISSLVNPFFWLLYAAWLLGGTSPEGALFPPYMLEAGTLTLLIGNFSLIYLSVLAPAKRRWYRLGLSGLLLPVYWVLQSAAGFIALYQLITRPYHWEKTTHHPEVAPEAALSGQNGWFSKPSANTIPMRLPVK